MSQLLEQDETAQTDRSSSPRSPRHGRRRLGDQIFGWALVLPASVILVAFTHYPIIRAVLNSLRDTGGEITASNYGMMLSDPIFWKVVRNNLLFVAGTVPTSIALALLMATWVNGKLRGRGFLRLAYFTPAILPMVAVAAIWLFFYTPGYGPIDTVLQAVGIPTRNWLGDPSTVLPALMVMTIWKEAGFFMIFYLAGLQNLSLELEEASQLEGASRWYHFRRVTFPLLMPTTLFVLVIAITNSFKQIDFLFVMTDGGPNNASSLLLYYIYEVAFSFVDLKYAATLTVALVAILGVMAFGQFFVMDRRVHYR